MSTRNKILIRFALILLTGILMWWCYGPPPPVRAEEAATPPTAEIVINTSAPIAEGDIFSVTISAANSPTETSQLTLDWSAEGLDMLPCAGIEYLIKNPAEKERFKAIFGDAEHDIALITQFMEIQLEDLPPEFRNSLPNILQDALIQWAPQVLRLMKKQVHREFTPTNTNLETELRYIQQFFTEYGSYNPYIHVELAIEQEAPVYLDADYMRAAIWNVVRNSHKVLQNKSSGSIRIHQHIKDDSVVITVEDNGPGFPPQLIDEEHMVTVQNPDGSTGKIQRAYARGETVGTGGSGFGLDIARHAIEQAQGSIFSENKPEGGAKTTITLPLRKTA